VLALYVVPVVGFIVYKVLGLLAIGVVVLTLILAAENARREREAARATAAPATASAAPASETGIPEAAGFQEGATAAAPAGESPVSALAEGSLGESAAGATEGAPGGGAAAEGPTSEAPAAARAEAAAGESPAGAKAEAPSAPPGATAASVEVTAAMPRAGFWIRMGALAIDAILIAILTNLVNADSDVWLILLAAYAAVLWTLKGTTVGGAVFGLKVVRLDGRPLEWTTSIVRALSCFLSAAVAGLGFIWIAFDDERQAWHDKIAGTVVVRVPKGVSLL